MLINIKKKITVFSGVISAVLLFILFVFSAAQVFMKYFFRYNADTITSIIGILLIWSFMFGAVYCFGENEHIAFNILASKIGKKTRESVRRICNILIFIFSASVLFAGGIITIHRNITQQSGVLNIILYFILPVSGILIAFISFSNITGRFTDVSSEDN